MEIGNGEYLENTTLLSFFVYGQLNSQQCYCVYITGTTVRSCAERQIKVIFAPFNVAPYFGIQLQISVGI